MFYISKEELKEIMKEHAISSIAAQKNVSKGTISKRIRAYDLSYEEIRLEKYPSQLSKIQGDFMIGSLLGDGSIHNDGHYSISQKDSSLEYIQYMDNLLKPFSKYLTQEFWKKVVNKNNVLQHINEGGSKGWKLATIIHPIFKELRKKWYPNNVKIVPLDIKLNPYILAIWMMDDGSNRNGKSKDIRLNTQSFTNEETLFLVQKLLGLNICSKMHLDKNNQPYIRIISKSYFYFMDLIRQYVEPINCFKYKINTINAPKDFIPIFKKKDLDKISELRLSGYTLKRIADKMGVSFGSVQMIASGNIPKYLKV